MTSPQEHLTSSTGSPRANHSDPHKTNHSDPHGENHSDPQRVKKSDPTVRIFFGQTVQIFIGQTIWNQEWQINRILARKQIWLFSQGQTFWILFRDLDPSQRFGS